MSCRCGSKRVGTGDGRRIIDIAIHTIGATRTTSGRDFFAPILGIQQEFGTDGHGRGPMSCRRGSERVDAGDRRRIIHIAIHTGTTTHTTSGCNFFAPILGIQQKFGADGHGRGTTGGDTSGHAASTRDSRCIIVEPQMTVVRMKVISTIAGDGGFDSILGIQSEFGCHGNRRGTTSAPRRFGLHQFGGAACCFHDGNGFGSIFGFQHEFGTHGYGRSPRLARDAFGLDSCRRGSRHGGSTSFRRGKFGRLRTSRNKVGSIFAPGHGGSRSSHGCDRSTRWRCFTTTSTVRLHVQIAFRKRNAAWRFDAAPWLATTTSCRSSSTDFRRCGLFLGRFRRRSTGWRLALLLFLTTTLLGQECGGRYFALWRRLCCRRRRG